MNSRDMFKLLLLAGIWGASFLLIRIAAPVLGAAGLVTARMLIASSALWLYARATGGALPTLRSTRRTYLTLAALNSAVPLTLEAFAVVHLSASLAAILAATTPLFTALAAALWLRERLTIRITAGLLLGMAGVATIVGWSELSFTGGAALGLGAALLSAVLYAVNGIYIKAVVRDTPALSLTIGQELVAGLLLLPLALAAPPSGTLSAPVVVATVTLALVMTAGGTLLYFDLIARLGPTQTQSVSFLVPGVAVLLGVLLLDEPLTAGMVVGLVLVLASVMLVTDVGDGARRRLGARLFRRSAQVGAERRAPVAQPSGALTHSAPSVARVLGEAPGYDRQSMRRHVKPVRNVGDGLHA
jgi:drug/metabolite transporter (DMT)-like permease